MYNVHPYFSLKNLGKKVSIIHGKTRYTVQCDEFVPMLCLDPQNLLIVQLFHGLHS